MSKRTSRTKPSRSAVKAAPPARARPSPRGRRAWILGSMTATCLAIGGAVAYVASRPSKDGGAPSARAVPPAPPLPEPDLTAADVLVREAIDAALAGVRQNPQSAPAWGRLGMVLDV